MKKLVHILAASFLAFAPGLVLAGSDVPANPSATRKAEYEEAKALYDAEKAKYEAELAMLKAKYASGVTPPFSGAVDLQDKGGSAEAQLLATVAIKRLAGEFGASLAGVTGLKRIVLLSESPDFSAALMYQSRLGGLDRVNQQLQNEEMTTASLAPAGATLALEAVSKLLGFFKTDYSFKNVALVQDDTVWTTAITSELVRNQVKVSVPAMRQTKLELADATDYLARPFELQLEARGLVLKSEEAIENIRKIIASAETELAGATKPEAKLRLESEIKAAKTLMGNEEIKKGVRAAFYANVTAFISDLITPSSSGKIALVDVMKQCALREEISGLRCVGPAGTLDPGIHTLVTKLSAIIGNSYIKKNFASSLGANPFFVTGGAIATATLIGSDGEVKCALSNAYHGGYTSASDVQDLVNAEGPNAFTGVRSKGCDARQRKS